MKRLAMAGALLLGGGCASFSTMSTARTVPPDTTQTWVAPEFVGMTIDTGSGYGNEAISVPQLEIGFRRGVTETAEVGAKLWLLGAALESKFQLVRSPSEEAGIDVAIAPSIGWLGFNSGEGDGFNVVTGYLSLPVGINVGGGSQLVLTPKAIYQRYIAKSGTDTGSVGILFIGGSAGFALNLGNTYVLPEISVMQPIIQGDAGESMYYDGVVFQGGVGLLFGG
jgi:hypothetical protein